MKWASLGEVCDINPRLSRNFGLLDPTEVSFVPMAAVSEKGAITNRQIRRFDEVKKGYSSFVENDVLFAKITPCMENGKAAIARNLIGKIGFGSTEFHVLRARESVLPEWIYYFVRQEAFRLEAKRNFTGTAGQQRVPLTFLKAVMLPVPSINEQQRIVDLLSRAEGIVRLRREAQQKAAEIIPALFLDMFGDPATNPKGWRVTSLGEHIDLLTGYAFKSGEFVNEADAVRLCRGANVLPLYIDWSDVRFWPQSRIGEVERFLLVEGDIVLAMDRPWISSGLKVARIGRADVPCLLVQRVARIRPHDSLITEYVYSVLCHEHFARHCNAVKTETVVPHISPHDIRSFKVLLPPITAQERFASLAEQGQSIIVEQTAALRRAEAIFDVLLAKSFTKVNDTA